MNAGTCINAVARRKRGWCWNKNTARKIFKNYQLYLLLLPVLAYYVIFCYIPMYGITLAFKEFDPIKGIFGNQWVGLKYFERFFRSYDCWRVIKNTLQISIYSLIAGFPVPIVLSLMLNEVRHKWFEKAVQTITYAPHFISTVVFVGMLVTFLNPSSGIINVLLQKIGMEPIHFMQDPKYFNSIYVFSGIWQEAGWGCIIYMAVLSTVDPELYEAGYVDGMNKLQKIWYIDFPSLLPTVSIMLILSVGGIMNVGFEKVFLMQNNMNIASSQVISTYVYNVGLMGFQFSYATAIGLLNSVVNFIMLAIVNLIVKRLGEVSLW